MKGFIFIGVSYLNSQTVKINICHNFMVEWYWRTKQLTTNQYTQTRRKEKRHWDLDEQIKMLVDQQHQHPAS